MTSFIRRLARSFTSRFKRRPERRANVWTLDDSGLEIVDPLGISERLDWSSVIEIVAFRANRIRANEIYLEFRCANEFTLLEESNIAFETIRAEVERRYGIAPGWLERLTQPPLEGRPLSLWTSNNPVELRKVR